jgi:hypothetical protein
LPTASIDFTLSASAMILLVMGAIFGVNMVAEPYLVSDTLDEGRYNQIARHILLSEGEPADWGVTGNLTYFGLASAGGAYELDVDKVARLHSLNSHSLDYGSIWQALGIEDVSFRIEMEPIFETTLNLDASQSQGGETTYNFSVTTEQDGYPLSTQLTYYVIFGNTTYTTSGTTDSTGDGTVQFTLPDSLEGTALLVGFAKEDDGMISYEVLPFPHNNASAHSSGTFALLSPHNYTLDVDLYENNSLVNAAFLSHGYSFNDPGWLHGWDQRVPITLDHEDVDSVLTDFPVLIYISNSSGRDDDNLSFIFDEISYANRKKIAVTTADGASQCYVEIEAWDPTDEEAWLWVRVPAVSNTTDTRLYLYYDAGHADNTDYVGEAGDASAQNVWDDDYVGVWHMSENPGGTPPQMVNSKSSLSHGTSHGFMSGSDQVISVVDGSLALDGLNDYLDFGNDVSLDITGGITIEAWLTPVDYSGAPDALTKGTYDVSYSLWIRADGTVRFALNNNPLTSDASLVPGTLYHIAATRSGSTRKIFVNGTEDISDNYGLAIGTTSGLLTFSTGSYPYEGQVDELRLSASGRSDAWVKATYENGIDDLTDFGGVETRESQDSINYTIPRLLDGSPRVLVVTGQNSTQYWAEWAAYPQIPLEVGVEIGAEYVISDVYSVSYIVEVEGALYRFNMMFRRPHRYE